MSVLLRTENLALERQGKRLLEGISFDFAAAEALAVLGPNGAGKSSLVRAVTGEWKSAGRIELFGQPLSYWQGKRQALARRLAVMTQQPQLIFGFRVREVIELGRLPWRGAGRAADQAVIDAVIERLQLGHLADRSYLTLSGGERQRVQFARVLAQIWDCRDGGILILDEPTSALDLAQQLEVLASAMALRERGIAVLVVLHDLNTALAWCERTLVLKQGRLMADGALPESLSPALIQQVYGVEVDAELAARRPRPVLLSVQSRSSSRTTASSVSPRES